MPPRTPKRRPRSRENEVQQKNKAVAAEAKARDEEALARQAEKKALDAQEEERKQKLIAIEAQNKAKAEEKKAVLAKQGEEYAAYVARIGMAAAKVEENAFDTAESLLAACLPQGRDNDLRNWEWGHLKQLCRQGINFDATGTVSSVAFAPDGTWFVAAGEDGQAQLWDRATGGKRFSIKHGNYVRAVAVSPDGATVATAGDDGFVHVASAKDGSLVHKFRAHGDRVLGVRFSPRDGRWLLTCSRDKTARLWDAATGHKIGLPLQGHSWWVWSAALSADEKQIATAGQDGKVIIWSVEPRAGEPKIEQQKVFLGHDGPVFAAAFSPDGRQVASAGEDKRVLVWETDKIKDLDFKQLLANQPIAPQDSRSLEGHSAPIRALAFSADGGYLLSAGDDNTVRTWDVIAGKLRTVLRGHSRPVQACAFSPDGRQVLSGGQQGQVKLWNILDYKLVRAPQGRILEGHQDAILSAAFSHDGRKIVTASRDHTACVYDAVSGQRTAWLKEGHEFLATRAIFFRGGQRLLTAGADDSVRIWDAATGAELSSVESTGRYAAVAVSRDAKWILTGKSAHANNKDRPDRKQPDNNVQDDPQEGDDSQPRIALWDLDADAKRARPHIFANRQFGRTHRSSVTTVAISPDAHRLFSGDETGVGKLWDAATGSEIATLKGHINGITDASFLPNSQRLLTASNDGTVMQWDAATGRALPSALSHADAEQRDAFDAPVRAIAVSPDGRQVLTLSEARHGKTLSSVVRLWNVERAKLIRELYRGGEIVTSVAFADGGHAAIAASSRPADDADAQSGASVVRRWELETGREVMADGGNAYLDFQGRQQAVWSAIEAPDGAGVLTVGGNGAAIWNPRAAGRPELAFKPHGGVTSASFSPDGRLVVTGSSDHRAKIWNAKTGHSELQLPPEHTRAINSALFSPVDARLLVTASEDGTARIWTLPERRVLHVLKHSAQGKSVVAVRYATFSPDGKSVLTACADRTARIWDASTGREAGRLKLDSPVLAVAYSADGMRIIVGGDDGRAVVFDAATRQPLVRYLGHTAAIHCVAFAPTACAPSPAVPTVRPKSGTPSPRTPRPIPKTRAGRPNNLPHRSEK